MFISKFLRARLIIFTIFFLFLWVTYYYAFRSTNISSVKDTTGLGGLIPPKMRYQVMNEQATQNVLITVFYECLCPDSRSFFVNQLSPVMEKFSKYITTELIPYGKAVTEIISDGLYNFKCQHGPSECLGNKIHACALNMIKDDLTKVRLVTCMFQDNNYNTQQVGRKCCKEYQIDWIKVENCALGTEGNELLRKHGDVTSALSPEITFIPTILLNKDQSDQAGILKDLKTKICSILGKGTNSLKECANE